MRIHATGGPEQLRRDDVEVPSPGRGEVRLRQTAVGVNFIDVYHRGGLYPLPGLPHALGSEAVGVVAALGPGVRTVKVGDRVGYAGGPPGAYAEQRVVPAARLLSLPQEIDDVTAASLLLKGLTAEYLVRRAFRVAPGHRVLVHAAAGGVGLLLCQWLRHLGATVFGTVGSEAKAQLALDHGCHRVIVYTHEDFVAAVRAATDNEGVEVVYDSVGKSTMLGSLDCLRRRGTLVLFGNASGPADPIDPRELGRRGSLYLTRPSLHDYVHTRQELVRAGKALFQVVAQGVVKPRIDRTLPLRDAAEAHRLLESRRTTGALVLVP